MSTMQVKDLYLEKFLMLKKNTFWLPVAVSLFFLLMPANAKAGMTIGEEREIGEKLLYKIRSELSLIDDPDIQQYINNLGQQVVSQVGPHYFDYHFFVVPHKEFNAFAAPSGLIFFYTGLIETMRTENVLLSVLAHEIGHIESRHIASRSDKNTKVGAISMALALASLALGDPSLSTGLFTGFQAAGVAANLHFSRIDEEQADRLSYDWMHAMRRDPHAMEGMLQTMRRITRYRTEQIPPYLLTHPNPEARLEYVQSLLDYQGRKVSQGYYLKVDNFDFLRMKHRVMVIASDPQKVRAYFTSILTSQRDEDEKMMARYGLAILQAKELNFDEALKNIDKVKAYFPGHSILDVDKGIMYLDSGETGRARELFESAAKEDPADMYAAFNLARTYAKAGNLETAEQLYRKVMTSMPEYAQVYFELGRIKTDQGHTGMGNFFLAKYYLYDGKLKFAREYFEKVRLDSTVTDHVREESVRILERLDTLENL